jgi:hypothetical protein
MHLKVFAIGYGYSRKGREKRVSTSKVQQKNKKGSLNIKVNLKS